MFIFLSFLLLLLSVYCHRHPIIVITLNESNIIGFSVFVFRLFFIPYSSKLFGETESKTIMSQTNQERREQE